MKNKYILLREAYDWLCVGNSDNELTTIEFNKLCRYLESKKLANIANYSYNKLKFINFVGIIAVDNLVIEILPKISLTKDDVNDRKMLIFMLAKCKKLKVNIDEFIDTNIIKEPLIEILGKIYIEKLLRELERGIYSEYVSQEDSLNKIKGKILITQNLQRNSMNKTKVYCKYDEFTENNTFNAILLKAANYLMDLVQNSKLKLEISKVQSRFEDVDNIYLTSQVLSNYKLNRRNERFREVFDLAKMILQNSSMDKSVGKENGLSILFEMNYLYEEYIGILLKEVIEDDTIEVNTQEKAKYLLWNTKKQKEEIALKPDIVIYKDGKPKIIIDTKWKASVYGNKENYSQGDIYQMYAYINTYAECERCILLYPMQEEKVEHSIWKLQSSNMKKEIEINEINLEKYIETINNLKTILQL